MPETAASRAATQRYLGAVAWMMGSLVSFTLVAIAAREASATLGVPELMFWRNFNALIILLVAVPLATGSFAPFKTVQLSRHVLRNVIHFFAQYAWLTALTLIPLAQLFALEFTAPLWVALMAPLILRERLTGMRLMAAAIGFFGALIVVKPGAEPYSAGMVAALVSAVGFALSLVLVKQLIARDKAATILSYMVFLQTFPSLLLAWPKLHLPEPAILAWVGVLALSSLTAHFSLARAFALADAIVVAPLDFLRLPLIAVVAAIFYAEPLDLLVLVGGGVIVAANLLNMWGERIASRDAGRKPLHIGHDGGNKE